MVFCELCEKNVPGERTSDGTLFCNESGKVMEDFYFSEQRWQKNSDGQEQAAKEAAAATAKKAFEANFKNCSEGLLAAREFAASTAASVERSRKEMKQRRAEEAKNLGPPQSAAEATKQLLRTKMRKALYIGVESTQGATKLNIWPSLNKLKETVEKTHGFNDATILCDSTDPEALKSINNTSERDIVLREIETLIRGANQGDILLIFFAGHSVNPPENPGDHYLCFHGDGLEEAVSYWPNQFKQLSVGVTLYLIMDCYQAARQFRQWEVERTMHPSGQQIFIFATAGETVACSSNYIESMCEALEESHEKSHKITNYEVSRLAEKGMWASYFERSQDRRLPSYPNPYYLWAHSTVGEVGEGMFLGSYLDMI